MTATAPLYILESWHDLESFGPRIHVRRGPDSTILDEGDLVMLAKKAQRTGTVRRDGVVLDESEIASLRSCYFARPDIDRDGYVLGFGVEDEHVVEVGPFTDEEGFDRTPGQWPIAGAL